MAVNMNINYGTQGEPELETIALFKMRTFLNTLGFDGSTLDFVQGGPNPGEGLEIQKDCATTPPRCYLILNDITWPSFHVASSQFPLFTMKTSTKMLIEDHCMTCGCP